MSPVYPYRDDLAGHTEWWTHSCDYWSFPATANDPRPPADQSLISGEHLWESEITHEMKSDNGGESVHDDSVDEQKDVLEMHTRKRKRDRKDTPLTANKRRYVDGGHRLPSLPDKTAAPHEWLLYYRRLSSSFMGLFWAR